LRQLPEVFRRRRHRQRGRAERELQDHQGATRKYDDSATHSGRTLSRHFCADCGSPVYSQRNPDPGFLVVRAGTLDDSSGMKIAGNIWTASARPWAFIDPATECHPGNMPPPPPKA